MKGFTALFLMMITTSIFSQRHEEIELCTALQSNQFYSESEANSALNRILDASGLARNFTLTQCDNINNAVAISYNGVRYILYDKEFLNIISDYTNDWSNLFILAHEVGHHLNGHSLDISLANSLEPKSLGKRRIQELEADEFAAFILAKFGAPLKELLEPIELIVSNDDDSQSTHPNKIKRINAITKGYNRYIVNNKSDAIQYNDDYSLSLKGDNYLIEESTDPLDDWKITMEFEDPQKNEIKLLIQQENLPYSDYNKYSFGDLFFQFNGLKDLVIKQLIESDLDFSHKWWTPYDGTLEIRLSFGQQVFSKPIYWGFRLENGEQRRKSERDKYLQSNYKENLIINGNKIEFYELNPKYFGSGYFFNRFSKPPFTHSYQSDLKSYGYIGLPFIDLNYISDIQYISLDSFSKLLNSNNKTLTVNIRGIWIKGDIGGKSWAEYQKFIALNCSYNFDLSVFDDVVNLNILNQKQ